MSANINLLFLVFILLSSCSSSTKSLEKLKSIETKKSEESLPPNFSLKSVQFNPDENGYILTNLKSKKVIEIYLSYPIFSPDLQRFHTTYYHHHNPDIPEVLSIYKLVNGEFELEFTNMTKGWVGMEYRDTYPEYSVTNVKWETSSKISFQKLYFNKDTFNRVIKTEKKNFLVLNKNNDWVFEEQIKD